MHFYPLAFEVFIFNSLSFIYKSNSEIFDKLLIHFLFQRLIYVFFPSICLDEVGSSVSEDIPTPFSADETFHVHKDGGTGGNFLAKIVFFVLMAALVVMVGLVITEYRGSTDGK